MKINCWKINVVTPAESVRKKKRRKKGIEFKLLPSEFLCVSIKPIRSGNLSTVNVPKQVSMFYWQYTMPENNEIGSVAITNNFLRIKKIQSLY